MLLSTTAVRRWICRWSLSAVVVVAINLEYSSAASSPITVEKIFVEKKTTNDLDTSASGYIYRSDGNGPPIYIKLGDDNIGQYEGVLKNSGIYSSNAKADISNPSSSSDNSRSAVHYPPKIQSQRISNHYNKPPKTITTFDSGDNGKYGYPIKMEPYKGKDEQNFVDFARQIESSHDDLPGHGEIPAAAVDDDAGYERQSPLTYFKSNAAGYEEHSEGYFDSNSPINGAVGNSNNNINKAGYIAPIFEAPDPRDVTFDHKIAPAKYPLSKLTQQQQQQQHHQDYSQYEDDGIPAAPLVTEDNVEYDGEDSDRNSQYVHHDRYNNNDDDGDHYQRNNHDDPEKYRQHYAKGGGNSYKSGHNSAHGEKGDEGFKKYHDFDEEEMGHHGKEGQKGFHKGVSGYHKDHHDDAEKHGQIYRGKHGEKAHKYGESEGHKKGHKTTGYHNIFHKDEYKKEQKFYDDAHKHGYHDKHGAFQAQHHNNHGGKTAAGHHESAYDDGHKGNSSKFKKGHYDQDHKGHKGASGHESHYNHFADYDKKAGHADKEKHGHHEQQHEDDHHHHHHHRR